MNTSTVIRFLALIFIFSGPIRAAEAPPAAQPNEFDLPAALRFALDHNFSIRQARERIKEQEGVLVETRAAALPNVALNSQYQQTDKKLQESFGSGGPSPNNQSWSITLEATQALFAGGKLSAAIRSGKAVREAALYELQAVINDALLDVRTKFYAVLLNRKKIEVQEQNLQLLEQAYKDAKSRYDAGVGAQLDLLRAGVAVANAQPLLLRARNDYRISIEQLRQSLGLSLDPSAGEQPLNIVGSLDYKLAQFDLAAALVAARVNRP
ncbi:MAG: TolC family protein, partial [Verrucomicrobiota bacterium]|nr:TolC family protein [Verrucomicrobiota bacterium]